MSPEGPQNLNLPGNQTGISGVAPFECSESGGSWEVHPICIIRIYSFRKTNPLNSYKARGVCKHSDRGVTQTNPSEILITEILIRRIGCSHGAPFGDGPALDYPGGIDDLFRFGLTTGPRSCRRSDGFEGTLLSELWWRELSPP